MFFVRISLPEAWVMTPVIQLSLSSFSQFVLINKNKDLVSAYFAELGFTFKQITQKTTEVGAL